MGVIPPIWSDYLNDLSNMRRRCKLGGGFHEASDTVEGGVAGLTKTSYLLAAAAFLALCGPAVIKIYTGFGSGGAQDVFSRLLKAASKVFNNFFAAYRYLYFF